MCLTPVAVVNAFFVPIRCGFKITGDVGVDVRFNGFFVEVDAQARSFWDLNESILNDRVGQSRDQVIPGGVVWMVTALQSSK